MITFQTLDKLPKDDPLKFIKAINKLMNGAYVPREGYGASAHSALMTFLELKLNKKNQLPIAQWLTNHIRDMYAVEQKLKGKEVKLHTNKARYGEVAKLFMDKLYPEAKGLIKNLDQPYRDLLTVTKEEYEQRQEEIKQSSIKRQDNMPEIKAETALQAFDKLYNNPKRKLQDRILAIMMGIGRRSIGVIKVVPKPRESKNKPGWVWIDKQSKERSDRENRPPFEVPLMFYKNYKQFSDDWDAMRQQIKDKYGDLTDMDNQAVTKLFNNNLNHRMRRIFADTDLPLNYRKGHTMRKIYAGAATETWKPKNQHRGRFITEVLGHKEGSGVWVNYDTISQLKPDLNTSADVTKEMRDIRHDVTNLQNQAKIFLDKHLNHDYNDILVRMNNLRKEGKKITYNKLKSTVGIGQTKAIEFMQYVWYPWLRELEKEDPRSPEDFMKQFKSNKPAEVKKPNLPLPTAPRPKISDLKKKPEKKQQPEVEEVDPKALRLQKELDRMFKVAKEIEHKRKDAAEAKGYPGYHSVSYSDMSKKGFTNSRTLATFFKSIWKPYLEQLNKSDQAPDHPQEKPLRRSVRLQARSGR